MMIPKQAARLITALLMPTVILLSTACMGPSTAVGPTYYYTVDYPPPDGNVERSLPLVLRVARFGATPPFNTQRIIYADKGLHRNAYASSQWIATPAEMIAHHLARDFQSIQLFKAVVAPDATLPSTHIVSGWVEEFIEEGFVHPGQASLRLTITLIDAMQPDPVERVLFQKSYSAKAPLAEQAPAALAEAMSEATARLAAEIIGDIQHVLTSIQSAP
jgi:ABC-type uncharacterized transport system auxiliary subunit